MSYSAFYSSSVAIRRKLRALDNCVYGGQRPEVRMPDAEGTLICQGGGSGVTHAQAGTGAT